MYNNGEKAESEENFRYSAINKDPVMFGRDWNNLLGNAEHIGIVSDTLVPPLSLTWIKNVGATIFMYPLIYKGNVYVASVDENLLGEGAVFALNGLTGDIMEAFGSAEFN